MEREERQRDFSEGFTLEQFLPMQCMFFIISRHGRRSIPSHVLDFFGEKVSIFSQGDYWLGDSVDYES